MDSQNERLGSLMAFSDIGLILSTFGVLLAFNYIINPISTNTWIVCAFFLGIKILVVGIADVTGIGKSAIVSALFILVADIVILLVNHLMAFGIPLRMLLVMSVVDIVIVVAAVLLWKGFAHKEYGPEHDSGDWVYEDDRNLGTVEPSGYGTGAMPNPNAEATAPVGPSSGLNELFINDSVTENPVGSRPGLQANAAVSNSAGGYPQSSELDDFYSNKFTEPLGGEAFLSFDEITEELPEESEIYTEIEAHNAASPMANEDVFTQIAEDIPISTGSDAEIKTGEVYVPEAVMELGTNPDFKPIDIEPESPQIVTDIEEADTLQSVDFGTLSEPERTDDLFENGVPEEISELRNLAHPGISQVTEPVELVPESVEATDVTLETQAPQTAEVNYEPAAPVETAPLSFEDLTEEIFTPVVDIVEEPEVPAGQESIVVPEAVGAQQEELSETVEAVEETATREEEPVTVELQEPAVAAETQEQPEPTVAQAFAEAEILTPVSGTGEAQEVQAEISEPTETAAQTQAEEVEEVVTPEAATAPETEEKKSGVGSIFNLFKKARESRQEAEETAVAQTKPEPIVQPVSEPTAETKEPAFEEVLTATTVTSEPEATVQQAPETVQPPEAAKPEKEVPVVEVTEQESPKQEFQTPAAETAPEFGTGEATAVELKDTVDEEIALTPPATEEVKETELATEEVKEPEVKEPPVQATTVTEETTEQSVETGTPFVWPSQLKTEKEKEKETIAEIKEEPKEQEVQKSIWATDQMASGRKHKEAEERDLMGMETLETIYHSDFERLTGSLPELTHDFDPIAADATQQDLERSRAMVMDETIKLNHQLNILMEYYNKFQTGDQQANAFTNLTEIQQGDDITESDRLIRNKLKEIIDKQFVSENVLHDLIGITNKINNRNYSLDVAEENLRERERLEAERRAGQMRREEEMRKLREEERQLQLEKARRDQEERRKRQEAMEREREALKQSQVERERIKLEREQKQREERDKLTAKKRTAEATPSETAATKPAQATPTLKTNEVHLQNDDLDIIIDKADLELLKEFLKQQEANKG